MPENNRPLSAALICFGIAFCLIPAVDGVAVGLGVARRTAGGERLFPDDRRRLCDARRIHDPRLEEPGANASLIWFVVWSSVVHAGVMAWESMRNPMMKGHLTGDVPALLLIAIVLGFLMSCLRTTNATVAA